ncbi:hypothetical protein Tco_0553098 [Tanacetum coccineum]
MDMCSYRMPYMEHPSSDKFVNEHVNDCQIKINLTATTLTFPSIEACNPFFIGDKPTVGLIYLNIKKEKRFMDMEEIPKLCDDTLEKVLNEVKLKIFESEFKTKTPLLGKLDLEIMKAYEREIVKRLKFCKRMRRWESFMNERPILHMM